MKGANKRVLNFQVKFPQLECNPGEYRGGRKLYGINKNFQTGDVIGDPNETRKRYIEIMGKAPGEMNGRTAVDNNTMRQSRSKSFVNNEMRRNASGMNKWQLGDGGRRVEVLDRKRSSTPNQIVEDVKELRLYPEYSPPKINKETYLTVSKQPVISLANKTISLQEKFGDGSTGSKNPEANFELEYESSPKAGIKLSESTNYSIQQLERYKAGSPGPGKHLSSTLSTKIERPPAITPEVPSKYLELTNIPLERSIDLDKKLKPKASPSYFITSVQDSSPASYKAPVDSSNIFNTGLLRQPIYTKSNPKVNNSNPITWFQDSAIERDRKLKDYGSFMLK
jgi:hypothetical protein